MSIWACYKLCGHPDQTQTSQANTKLSDLVVLFYGNLEHLRIQYRYLDICLNISNQYTFYLFLVVLYLIPDIWLPNKPLWEKWFLIKLLKFLLLYLNFQSSHSWFLMYYLIFKIVKNASKSCTNFLFEINFKIELRSPLYLVCSGQDHKCLLQSSELSNHYFPNWVRP